MALISAEKRPGTLAYYTEQVKTKTEAELIHALNDIHKTIPLFENQPEHEDYVKKLYNELDAIRTELGKRKC